jgi:hypothetical protein
MNLNKNFMPVPGTNLQSEKEAILRQEPPTIFKRKLSLQEYNNKFSSMNSEASLAVKLGRQREHPPSQEKFNVNTRSGYLKPDSATRIDDNIYIETTV